MKIDTKERLEVALRLAGVNGEWINQDENGFSREYKINISGQEIIIEWYCNYSTVKVGNLHFWADGIHPDSGYPFRGRWIDFLYGDTHIIHLKVDDPEEGTATANHFYNREGKEGQK